MIKWLIIFLLIPIIVLGDSLRAVKTQNGVVFTNLSKNLFFIRAFKYSTAGRVHIIEVIKNVAKKYGVDPKIVVSIAKIESNFKSEAVSKKNAKGVMQLISKTAKYYGVANPYDINQNIEGGVKFLKHLIEKYHNVKLVAAAYNAGESAVDRYGKVPPYKETQNYVREFLKLYNGSETVYILKKHRSVSIVKVNGVYTNLESSLW